MATLHILRNLDSDLCRQSIDGTAGDTLLLIQDAVLNPGPFDCRVSVCQDDLAARSLETEHDALSYDDIRDLMLAHERVVLW